MVPKLKKTLPSYLIGTYPLPPSPVAWEAAAVVCLTTWDAVHHDADLQRMM